jgi:DNA-binding CsgD family transcriptional regulator
MSFFSLLKEKFAIRLERKMDKALTELEPIHRPSFSIGDSLGDIKVALMDLKCRMERVEGCMLSREYFDESMDRRDKSSMVIGKLDESLRVLADFQPRKPSLEPTKTSLTEEARHHVRQAIESLRLRQVMTVFASREMTTPKQLAKILGIRNNTATEHLRRLEKLGYVRRVRRGLYVKA